MSAMLKISANPDMIARRALGVLRFVDAATGQSITDGLSVIARVRNRAISAVPSASGVYIFHQLPGLSLVSFWDGETKPEPEPQSYEFNIEVRDTSRRFFPVAFNTTFTDWPEAKLICNDVSSPINKIPLFSVPWRLQRYDYAIIRGTLRLHSSDEPAAWALLRVFHESDDVATATPVIEGVAGADGSFLLMYPWPQDYPMALTGPTGARWSMRILAWYDVPDAQIPEDELPDGDKRLPALCSILKQRRAILLAESNSSTELPPQEMIPGQTVLLKTSQIPPVTPEEKILYLETT